MAASSKRTRVSHSIAMPARQTRKAISISPGSPPVEEKVRGWMNCSAMRTARKLRGTKAPAVIANTDA